jgi:hypothetical protein
MRARELGASIKLIIHAIAVTYAMAILALLFSSLKIQVLSETAL